MSDIQGIAGLEIRDGKLKEFKHLAVKCMEPVRTRDSGTLQYDWFYSSDYAECVVVAGNRDSEAFPEHTGNLGKTMDARGIAHATSQSPGLVGAGHSWVCYRECILDVHLL